MDNSNCYKIDLSNIEYNPISLIFHDYPTRDILDKVKSKRFTIIENTRLINRIKRKLVKFIEKKEKELNINNTDEFKISKHDERIERIRIKTSKEDFELFYNVDIISWKENDSLVEKSLHDTIEYFNTIKTLRNNLRLLEIDEMTQDIEICNKAICVGTIPDKILPILDKISEDRNIPKDDSVEYQNLVEHFGENFKNDWGKLGKDLYTEIRFLPVYILPNSTIFYVQRIIEIYFGIRIPDQYLWSYIQIINNTEKDFLFSKLYYNLYDDNNGLTQSSVKTLFENLGFTHSDIIKRVFNIEDKINAITKEFDENLIDIKERDQKIENIYKSNYTLDDFRTQQPLSSIILNYLQYQSLTFDTILDKNIKIGQWPDENPYFALTTNIEGGSVPFLELRNKDKIKYTNVNQNRTINNFGKIEHNEIHWVGLPKIYEYLRKNRIVNLGDESFMQDYIQSTINRFFYKIDSLDKLRSIKIYEPIQQNIEDINEDSRIIDLYLNGNSTIAIPDEINYELLCRTPVEIKIGLEQPVKSNIESFNLRDILNRIILNNDMPFVRLYDDQRNENIFRIYKPSFGIGSNDKITIDQLEKWIHRENLILNLGKLTKIHEPKKCLTFKVRLCNQQIGMDTREIMTKTLTSSIDNIRRYNIYYTDGLYEENVESYLITDDDKFVYEHSPIFFDIYFFELQGFIEMKVIFQPIGISENFFYNFFIEKINKFIISIRKDNPYFSYLNTINSSELIMQMTNFSNNYIINMSSILEYRYKSQFYLDYDKLRRIISIFTPFFTMIETTYLPKTEVEFLFDGVHWKKDAYILKCNIDDGTYNIVYNDGSQRIVVERVKPYLIKQVGEKNKNYYINFRYKRVSNYIKEQPIIEILKKNSDWGLTLDQIKDKILKMYDISADEIDDLNKQVSDANDKIRKQTDRRVEQNGIDIKIYLEPEEDEYQNKAYKIELDHYRNILDFNNICQLLDLIYKIYYIFYYERNDLFIEETYNIDTSIATYELREERNQQLQQQMELEQIDILDEFGLLDESEAELSKIDKPTELLEKPKKEQIINEEILDFDFEMMGSSNNYILEKLYKTDRKLFYWESTDKKQKYSIACMGTKRYPKVVGPEQWKYIYNQYKDGLGLTYLGNKDISGNPEILVDEEYCEPDKHIDVSKKCVSIKYGSQDESSQWNNFYMCPKIWCVRDKIPLHPRSLLDGENKNMELGCSKFVSKADITSIEIKSIYKTFKEFENQEYIIWRICKNCNEDILNHNIKCPECRCAPLEATNTNLIPTKTTSLYIAPRDTNFIYPGFVNPDKHPNKIPAVCCFNNANSRLNKKFLISSEKTNYNTQAYIQSFGKELQPGRFGQLPLSFSGFMELDVDYFSQTNIRCDSNSKNYYYRYGILSTPSLNALSILSFYLLLGDLDVNSEIDTLSRLTDIILHNIIKRITRAQFNKYPMLEYAFRSGDISSLQNYIEFLISDDPKPEFTLLQLLNKPLDWLGNIDGMTQDMDVIEVGVNIFILSMNDDGKMVIEIPRGFVQPYEMGIQSKSILLFRNKNIDNMLEPIVFTNRTCDKQHGSNTSKINKFFDYDNPIISKIFNEIIINTNIEEPPKAIFSNLDNQYLNIIDFHDKTFNNVMKNAQLITELGFIIQSVVLDNNNLVVGFIIADVYIPVYPSSYDERLDGYNIIKYLDIFDSLPNFKTVFDTINKLISSNINDFSYLTIINNIRSISLDEYLFTGYYTHCGIIIPFQPIKKITTQSVPTINIDFYEIEKAIANYQKKQHFTPKLQLNDIEKVLNENVEYKYVIDDKNILKGIVVFSIDFGFTETFIPLVEMEWMDELPNVEKLFKDNIPKYGIEVSLDNYSNIYKAFNGRIPSRIIGVNMIENTKAIDKLLIETGDYIPVKLESDGHIYKKLKNGRYRYLLHRIQEIELEMDEEEDTYNYEKFHTDSRIDFIMSLNFTKYSFERFRFEVARILNISDANIRSNGRIVPKREILDLISNNKLGIQEKRILLTKMIINLVKNNIEYKYVDINKIGKGESYVEQTCSIHKEQNLCNTDPFCNWINETNSLSLDTFKNKNRPKIINILKGLNVDSREQYLNSMKKYIIQNGKKWDDSNVDNLINIDNKLEIDYYKKGNCRLVLFKQENVDLINSKYIRKIVDEILRNSIKRREILENTIKIVDTRLSYNVYPKEVFYTEKDIKSNMNELKTFYQLNRRSRLHVFNHFTKNSSKYFDKIEIVENNLYIESKLRDNSYILYTNTGYIPFTIVGSQILNPGDESKIHNITILDNNALVFDIIRMNTPLDKLTINHITKNVAFKILKKEGGISDE